MLTNLSLGPRFRLYWPLILVILLVIPLFVFRLVQVPRPWYDEGLNINAAQTFATSQVFGLTTQDTVRLADPAIQSGPPLVMLMGMISSFFDNSLFAIRAVMIIFGVVTLISLYALSYRMYGGFAAFLLALMLVSMPPSDTTSTFVMLSRQFLGEIPAVLCISLGCHLLLREQPTSRTYILTGVLWALALIIKSQVFLILSLTVAVWVLYRLITNKPDKYGWLLIGVIMFGLYGLNYLWQSYMAGPLLAQNTAILREGIGIHILPFRTVKNLREWSVLVRFFSMVITLLAMGFFTRPGSKPSPIFQLQTRPVRTIQNFIALFVGIWMVWFAFVSIGWARYSFVGIIFTFVILSGVLAAVWTRIKLPSNRYVYIALTLVAVAASYAVNLKVLRDPSGTDFFNMVSDIKTQLPPDARIVTLEWAADNFLPQRFIYPSTHVINVITENAFNRPNNNYNFDSIATCPQYVLLGSLTLDVGVLKPVLDISKPEPLFQHGLYKLYEVNADQLPASCKAKP